MELASLSIFAMYLLLAWFAAKAGQGQNMPVTALLSAVSLACLAHGWLLHLWIDTVQGQNLSLLNMLSLSSWVMLLLCLGLCFRQFQAWLLVVSLGFAASSLLLAHYWSGKWLLPVAAQPGSLLHILSSVAAFSLLALAAVQSLLHLLLNQRLKKPLNHLPSGLPPLQRLETLRYRLLGAGYGLLSLSLISGMLYVKDFLGQQLLHKTVLAGLAWLILTALLIQHLRGRISGRIASIWTLSAFGLVLLGYLGSKFVIEILLQPLPG